MRAAERVAVASDRAAALEHDPLPELLAARDAWLDARLRKQVAALMADAAPGSHSRYMLCHPAMYGGGARGSERDSPGNPANLPRGDTAAEGCE